MKAENFKKTMNRFGKKRQPFIFIIDFDALNPIILPIDSAKENNILFDINGFNNCQSNQHKNKKFTFRKNPVDFLTYKKSFDLVIQSLHHGNSYLTNLTFPTPIETNITLQEIFFLSKAKYKLLFKNQFVVFSPEIFIKINDGIISSYPMKGTIDASIPDAQQKIIENKKELAEHHTIVDLIRNDLSQVAKNVKVERFRYVEEISTNQKKLLQVSSKITGKLPTNYHHYLGDFFSALLPAGSISGAPKKKTIEIIKEAENYDRGYYTGVFGYFDGKNIDSGVMIRFIENINNQLFYKSGGGITIFSEALSEYQEMIDKVYVPLV